MKTFMLSENLVNRLVGVVTSLPWAQANPIMIEVQKELSMQPAEPAPEAPKEDKKP